MSNQVLTKIRKLNWVLSESTSGFFSFDELCKILGELMNSTAYIVSKRGKVLAAEYSTEEESPIIHDDTRNEDIFPDNINQKLIGIDNTMANLTKEEIIEILQTDYSIQEKYHTIVPIIFGGRRIGTVVLARVTEPFDDEDIAICEYGATVVGIEISRGNALEEEKEERLKNAVTMALETLSYSEMEAVIKIFSELQGDDGLLVASKIADKSGITRSVIVNALRKLESAGVIESRSLGMKGTKIKIINEFLREEIAKIKI